MTTKQKTWVGQGRDYNASKASSIVLLHLPVEVCDGLLHPLRAFLHPPFYRGRGLGLLHGQRYAPIPITTHDGIIRQYSLFYIERKACVHFGATSGAAGRGGKGAFAVEVV